jgi:hypothetical protein
MTATSDVLWGAAIAGGAAVASAAIASVSTYRVTRRSIVAQQQQDLQGRLFERRADAYLLLNHYMARYEIWLRHILGVVSQDRILLQATAQTQPPSDDSYREAMANCRTFASEAVSDKIDEVRTGIDRVTGLCWNRETLEFKHPTGEELELVVGEIERLRLAIRALARVTYGDIAFTAVSTTPLRARPVEGDGTAT